METLEQAFERVKAIRWEAPAPEESEERDRLMVEFVGTMRELAISLSTGKRTVFQSLAHHFEEDLDLPPEMDAWLETLLARLLGWRGRHYAVAGVWAYLCWCLHAQSHPEHAALYGNPYEPLIRFLESGGEVYVEHGTFLTIYPSMISMNIRVDPDAVE